ncbi:MAG: 50S ribosomal protein L20 [Candidatus Omnitrophica bacterium]|nr:50S ribosomal protein L20 [Candidatus Omnitrophota bacterium]
MVRVRSAISTRKRKKGVVKSAKGQFGHRSRRYQQAKRSIIKGMAYAFRDRKAKKREFRALWILRINAACQEEGVTYSRFINGLKKAKVDINRKALSEMAISSPAAFKKLVKLSKESPSEESKKKKKTASDSTE